MQNYSKSEEIPENEAQNLFKYRVRVAQCKENLGDKYMNTACPLCSMHLDNQVHAIQCEIKISVEGKYSDKEKYPPTSQEFCSKCQS